MDVGTHCNSLLHSILFIVRLSGPSQNYRDNGVIIMYITSETSFLYTGFGKARSEISGNSKIMLAENSKRLVHLPG